MLCVEQTVSVVVSTTEMAIGTTLSTHGKAVASPTTSYSSSDHVNSNTNSMYNKANNSFSVGLTILIIIVLSIWFKRIYALWNNILL